MRALFGAHRDEVLNVCSSPFPPPTAAGFAEVHLPSRPHLGRLEATRANRLLTGLDIALGDRFAAALMDLCEEVGASAIHGIAHTLDFSHAYRVARSLRTPFLLSVHDDLRYAFRDRLGRGRAEREVGPVWREADRRFVVSEPLGEEYARRYGQRPYEVVTDGLSNVVERAWVSSDRVGIYFAGLFHLAYHPNLQALTAAVSLWRRRGCDVSMTFRCGAIDVPGLAADVPISALPFAGEDAVARDLDNASLLYLPLPFEREHTDFVRFSLSTKLITYLGSGIPILYHGPPESATGRLLMEYEAAIVAPTLDASTLCEAAISGLADAERLVTNAGRLAFDRFGLDRQRAIFWEAIDGQAGPPDPRSSG